MTKQIDYQNDLGDLMSFNVHHSLRNPSLYVIIVFFSALMFREARRLGDGPAMQAAILATWIGFYLVFVFVMTGVNVVLNYRRTNNKTIFARHVLTLSPDGVSETTELSTISYSWKAVSRIRRNRRLLMIYAQSNMAFLIPRRAFKTDAELAEFEKFAAECWKKSSHAA